MSSLKAEVTLKWADGTYTFRLGMDQLEELQKKCGAPFGVIASRVFRDEFDIRDIVHTIRLGLIGGGMPAVEALDKIEFYVDGKPLAPPGDPSSSLAVARVILSAVYFGLGDIDLGEQKAGATDEGSSTFRPTEPLSSMPALIQEPSDV